MKKTISAWLREYWTHIFIWSIFISYEVIAIGLLAGAFGHPVNYISHYILTIGMFYLSALVILPAGLKDRNAVIWKLPLGVMFLFVSFLLTNFAVDLVMIHYKFAIRAEGFNLSRSYTGKILYRWVYVFGNVRQTPLDCIGGHPVYHECDYFDSEPRRFHWRFSCKV